MGKKSSLKKIKKLEQGQSQILQGPGDDRVRNNLWRVIFIILFLSVLAIGITLRITNFANVYTRSPDEGIYTFQAKAIVQQGAQGIKSLIQEYNLNKQLWIYPPPTRVGYLWLLADVMRITKNTDEKAGAYISCTFSILSLLLLIVLGLRFFNPWITLCALLFMSVSPMDLAIARRTWQDAMLGCFGLCLIYFCCEIMRNTHKLIWFILFIVVGSYCILIKESGILIYGLCMLWILWIIFVNEKSYLKGLFLMIVSALGVGISLFVLAYAAGGISPIIEILSHVKEAMPTNRYAIEYQSGPWYYFLQGFWLISPVNALFYLVAITGIILPKGTLQKITSLSNNGNRHIVLGIVFFAIVFMVIAIAIPYCINLRYVSVLFVPFYLISALGLWYAVSFAKVILSKSSFYIVIAFVIGAAVLAAVSDYQNFKKIFVRTGILDVSIRMIREYSR